MWWMFVISAVIALLVTLAERNSTVWAFTAIFITIVWLWLVMTGRLVPRQYRRVRKGPRLGVIDAGPVKTELEEWIEWCDSELAKAEYKGPYVDEPMEDIEDGPSAILQVNGILSPNEVRQLREEFTALCADGKVVAYYTSEGARVTPQYVRYADQPCPRCEAPTDKWCEPGCKAIDQADWR